jgi:hypothetical protein
MDTWLDEPDIDALIRELNPSLQTGKDYDANWELLKRERVPLIDFESTVKTQSPTLLEFERNYSFVYRRYDGAHWHTELREVDSVKGLTTAQRQLKDSIDTLLALTHSGIHLKWRTPIVKKTNQFDPRYQLLTDGNTWYCCINDCVYEQSNRRQRKDKGYTEITFSTRKTPVFTQTTVDLLLDKYM